MPRGGFFFEVFAVMIWRGKKHDSHRFGPSKQGKKRKKKKKDREKPMMGLHAPRPVLHPHVLIYYRRPTITVARYITRGHGPTNSTVGAVELSGS